MLYFPMSILASNCLVNSKFTKSYLLIMGCRNFKCLFMMLSITVFICFFFISIFSKTALLLICSVDGIANIPHQNPVSYVYNLSSITYCTNNMSPWFCERIRWYFSTLLWAEEDESNSWDAGFFKMENRGFGRWLELLLFFTDFRYFGGCSQRCYIIESVSQSFSVLLLYRVVISYLNK